MFSNEDYKKTCKYYNKKNLNNVENDKNDKPVDEPSDFFNDVYN